MLRSRRPFCFMHKFRRKIPCIFWKGNDTLSMEHSTEVLYNRTMVYCTPEHRFGSDALLLARFCEPKRSQKAADLCSGCGIVALEWHDRGHRGPCTALELQPEGSALLAAAVEEQQLTHITPVCADLRTWRQDEGQFDVCACNPPYFTEGPQSQNAAHALARHENTCALEDVCACGFRLLKDGGRLALCHRPERLAEVLDVLRELSEVATLAVVTNGFQKVQIRRLAESGVLNFMEDVFVSEKMDSEKPNRRIFDAALRALGVENREHVLVVGDGLSSDIQGGVNAGLDTCWYNPSHAENPGKVVPTYEIADLKELYPLVMEQEELANVGLKNRRHQC